MPKIGRQKSTQFKLVTGNRGKGKLNDSEPIPKGKIKKPEWVKGYAEEVWNHLAPDLIEQRVMTAWDVYQLGLYCMLVGELAKNPAKFPASKMAQMRITGQGLGIGDARARAQIKTGKPKQEKTEEEYFGT